MKSFSHIEYISRDLNPLINCDIRLDNTDMNFEDNFFNVIYNIGGNNEKSNIEIVKFIITTLRKSESLIKYVKDRPGHDRRYAIDNTKITTQLGWEPAYAFEQGMKETIKWYLNNTEWIENIVSGDYVNYYEKMYSKLADEETNS